MESLIDKNELHRLKKALKNEKDSKLESWAYELQRQIESKVEKEYDKRFDEQTDMFLVLNAYLLHFNSSTKFGGKRLTSFMNDLVETLNMIERKEIDFVDLKEQLEKDNIYFYETLDKK